ncbi:MAG: DUF2167 domain-containing protein [Rhodobacteraceae bacterium]|nr:DUF2167 domain-containing protein [Paracoccaceae bacterium]
MIFPSEHTPFDQASWGVTILWDPSGYVKDADINYAELLDIMKSDTSAENEWRRQNNYPDIRLVGWAAGPYYDQAARKLHWAKEFAFAGDDVNTLNYFLRALGRRGVLELNFISGINQLDQIKAAIPEIAALISFNEGSRYRDFVPSMDTVAAIGIGGLIAGKVLAKTSFLIVALLFLKKFSFLLLLPLVWVCKISRGGEIAS